jgi:hypothetical protein
MQQAARGRPVASTSRPEAVCCISGTADYFFMADAAASMALAAASLAASFAASAVAVAAPATAEAAASAAPATAEAASEAASATGVGAGAGAAAGAGAGAGASSFLPQADRATAATSEANTSDLFMTRSLDINGVRAWFETLFYQRGAHRKSDSASPPERPPRDPCTPHRSDSPSDQSLSLPNPRL